MSINLGMWKNSLSELIKMDSKEEWKSLDVVSKWFIATRSAVTIVTIYSAPLGDFWQYDRNISAAIGVYDNRLVDRNSGAFPGTWHQQSA